MSLSAAATDFRSFQETKSRLWRSRWTMQVCTVACGKTAVIASGKPFRPSTTATSTSSTPRFFSSFMMRSQNGIVNLGGAWRADPGRVGNWNVLALCQVTLCRLPFPAGGDQPRGLAVLPLLAQLAHGRGDADRARHHREP